MKKVSLLFLTLATLAMAKGPKVPYTHQGFYSTDNVQKAVHFVSVEDIENSLKGQPPINVSFDIDDTLVHSSGYFRYGQDHFQTDPKNPASYLFNQKFWDFVSKVEMNFLYLKNLHKI